MSDFRSEKNRINCVRRECPADSSTLLYTVGTAFSVVCNVVWYNITVGTAFSVVLSCTWNNLQYNLMYLKKKMLVILHQNWKVDNI